LSCIIKSHKIFFPLFYKFLKKCEGEYKENILKIPVNPCFSNLEHLTTFWLHWIQARLKVGAKLMGLRIWAKPFIRFSLRYSLLQIKCQSHRVFCFRIPSIQTHWLCTRCQPHHLLNLFNTTNSHYFFFVSDSQK